MRKSLPLIKAGAIVGLVLTARRPRERSVMGATLLMYYSAAVSFHRSAGDPVASAVPAAILGILAASLV